MAIDACNVVPFKCSIIGESYSLHAKLKRPQVSHYEVGTDGIKIVSNIKLCNVSFATVVSS